jgi:cytoskeletal protein CcmA (bactofilin family)
MDNITELNEISVPRGRTRNGNAVNVVMIGPRDELKGSLTVDGDLRVEGRAEGELRASGDVEVEAGATVNAQVEGRNVTVRGTLAGNVVASKKLNVYGSGSISGDVRTPRLRVDDGTVVNGSITMHPEEVSVEVE